MGIFQAFNRSELPGVIKPYGGATAPSGYLICDGAEVSRVTFAELFAVVGTTYGPGDNSTTFNVPNLKGRVPHGKADAGTGSALGQTFGSINHNHSLPAHYHGMGSGADLAIINSGAHQHFTIRDGLADAGTPTVNSSNTIRTMGAASVGNDFSYDLRGVSDFTPNRAPTNAVAHNHSSGDISGRIGLVSGGVNGNSSMTSGTGNHPSLVTHFIIKT